MRLRCGAAPIVSWSPQFDETPLFRHALVSDDAVVQLTYQPRLEELDSLRGLAAISVLLFHFTFYHDVHHQFPFQFRWGHYGVELFFVISGFVILMTLERSASVLEFLISRVARLYPAYWCAVLLTSAVAFALGRSAAPPWNTVLANLTMFHTALRFPPIDLSYWTLTVELVFYAMMVLWFRYRSGGNQRIEWYALGWLVIVACIRLTLLIRHDVDRLPQLIALPLLVYYGQFFVVGICLYRVRSREFDSLTLVTLVFACAMSLFGEVPGGLHSEPRTYFLLSCAITIVVWAAIRYRPSVLRHPILVFFGTISYPLYLIHQRVGDELTGLLWDEHWPAWISIPMIITGIICLAYAIHVLVEMPGRAFLKSALTSRLIQRAQSVRPGTSLSGQDNLS
jgi:peptidoglycan/LPS O-acetylase OafA/YrhL